MNPIKANMVTSLEDYLWSSFGHNALGIVDELISEHSVYLALGDDVQSRCDKYKALFERLDLTKQNVRITQATMRGEVYGSSVFHQQIEKLISRPTLLLAHGATEKALSIKIKLADPLIAVY
ncbi:hypothetical protein LCGC14_0760660 [marine sediment metagenome]|uniref:Uncharacterized protein n=1 Tax=marine sediment metagenome TaxID=412755 RepID=A0A0F9SL90_9ZZZZ|nr:hypothetical protein [Methylophaga sp.]HEC58061.1 hypothetical protein [Methylophaga sp.]